jgi:glycosyltransferase involved in cell wall biosynthesis
MAPCSSITMLMPAYNAEATIAESISSLQAQTYTDWELLVLDDGSSDRTAEICSAMAAGDPRIKVIRLEHQGLCGVLNYGLRTAKTRLIGRLDSDDICGPIRLEKQLKFLAENPDVKVLGTWGRRINNSGRAVSKMHLGPGDRDAYQRQRQDKHAFFLIHSSVVADRETLLSFGGYSPEEYPSEDVWLWTRVAQKHVVLAYPEELTDYRINGRGISNSNFLLQHTQTARLRYSLEQNRWVELKEFRSICSNRPLLRMHLYIDYLHRYWFRTGAGYFVNDRPIVGASYLALSALLNPANLISRAVRRS